MQRLRPPQLMDVSEVPIRSGRCEVPMWERLPLRLAARHAALSPPQLMDMREKPIRFGKSAVRCRCGMAFHGDWLEEPDATRKSCHGHKGKQT